MTGALGTQERDKGGAQQRARQAQRNGTGGVVGGVELSGAIDTHHVTSTKKLPPDTAPQNPI